MLPRPTIARSRQPPPEPPSRHELTLSEILKLPSTVSSSSTSDYTVLVYLTSSSQMIPSHLSPLITSFAHQRPIKPSHVVLLCPSGMEPSPDFLASLSSSSSSNDVRVSTLTYSPTDRDHSPLLTIATAAAARQFDTRFVLYVDGHLPPTSLRNDHVDTLVHAFGTKEFASSILSARGVALASSSSSAADRDDDQDECVYPYGDDDNKKGRGRRVSRRISIPSTPFLLPVSWLVPRSHSAAPKEGGGSSPLVVTTTSPTILQGVPNIVHSLPPEVGLCWALWTKSGIPAFALPIPLGSVTTPRATSSSSLDGSGCERLQKNLAKRLRNLYPAAAGGGGGATDGGGGTVVDENRAIDAIRNGFRTSRLAGEGLRRIKGDRLKGGGGGRRVETSKAKTTGAAERAREMRRGSLVLLLSGREELDAVRKIACRYAGGGVDDDDDDDDDEDEDEDEDEGRGISRRRDRELRIIIADWDGQYDDDDDERRKLAAAADGGDDDELCHLEVIPLGRTTGTDETSSISLPLIDLLDSQLDPAPAVVVYVADGPRAREFEEVLKWIGGIFGVRKGGERVGRVRMERDAIGGGGGGDGAKPRMTVIAIEKEELERAEWIGALPIEALRREGSPPAVPRRRIEILTESSLTLSRRLAHSEN